MSYKVSYDILFCHITNRTAKMVLRCLADFLDDEALEEGVCVPTETLCELLVSERHAIYRALTFLQENGWISVVKRGSINRYYLDFKKIARCTKIEKPEWIYAPYPEVPSVPVKVQKQKNNKKQEKQDKQDAITETKTPVTGVQIHATVSLCLTDGKQNTSLSDVSFSTAGSM